MDSLKMRFAVRAGVLGALLACGVTLTASAQGPVVSGSVVAGFGQARFESTTPETTQLEGAGEAIVNVFAQQGDVSLQIELEVNDATALETAQHEVAWRITPALRLIISGHSFGIEPTDGRISVVNAAVGPVGDEEAFLDFSDTGMANAEWSLGKFIVGLALVDTCIPECGYAADAEAPGGVLLPDVERRSTVLHFRREGEDLQYNLYVAGSEGGFTQGATLIEGKGSGGGAGLWYERGDFGLGLDASSATVECQRQAGAGAPGAPASKGAPCGVDNEVKQWGIAVRVAGFAAHYYAGEDRTGTDYTETVNVDLVYVFEVGENAAVGPEFRSTSNQTFGSGAAPKTTDSYLLFGMSLEF